VDNFQMDGRWSGKVARTLYDQHEKEQWEYIPGLLQLMEEGVTLEDLATRPFVAPQVRGTGLATPETELDPAQNRRLARMWDWLRGFRRDATLCERAPIWVPIAQA